MVQERKKNFKVLGQEFQIRTDASEEEIEAVFDLVKERIEQCAVQPGKHLGIGRASVLACLSLASSVIQLRKEMESFQRLVDGQLEDWSGQVEHALKCELQSTE